jgi:uncharacterized surface protein with fasciclin (FAS1) repeats
MTSEVMDAATNVTAHALSWLCPFPHLPHRARSLIMLTGLAVTSAFMVGSAPVSRISASVMRAHAVEMEVKDIVDTAVDAGSFKTLAAALGAASLVDTLKGEGPFTVFAPTDEAFAKLPKGTVDDLLKPENKEKLAGILTYHVVSGKVMAETVVTMYAFL